MTTTNGTGEESEPSMYAPNYDKFVAWATENHPDLPLSKQVAVYFNANPQATKALLVEFVEAES